MEAATFVVTRFDDDDGACTPDDCALREAVIAANGLPGLDRIELEAGVYPLTIAGADPVAIALPESGDLDILDDLELVGPAGDTAVVVGNGDDRVIEILFTTVAISNVTLTGGRDLADFGGCVRMLEATARFVDSSISGCFCEREGGGVGAALSFLTLVNSTLSENVSQAVGGGIAHISAGVTLVNSTISGNRAAFLGGGIANFGGGLEIHHSTITGNQAPQGDALYSESVAEVFNSILSGKCMGFAPSSAGQNLAGPDLADHCLSLTALPEDLAAEDLGLGPLADYGGPTMTHALLAGSPAIDAANPDNCEATDQRGVSRPQGAECDIGAFEGFLPVPAIPVASGAGLAGLAILLLAAGLAVIRRGSSASAQEGRVVGLDRSHAARHRRRRLSGRAGF
jgi:CSLREA domain-containing protein